MICMSPSVQSLYVYNKAILNIDILHLLWHLIAAILLASQVDVLVKWLKVHSDRVVAVLEHVISVTSSTSLAALGNWPVYGIPPNYETTNITLFNSLSNLFDIPVQDISLQHHYSQCHYYKVFPRLHWYILELFLH